MTREEAVSLFEKRRRAWLAEDLSGYLDCFAEDLVFQSPVHTEPLRGRAAFADLVRGSLAFARPVAFDFHDIAVDGATVLAEWTITIERRGDARRLCWRGMSTCEIRDGRIVRWREYWNPADLA